MTAFGNLIFRFTNFISPFFALVFISTEMIYQKLKTVFDHISKHHEKHQKHSATTHGFNLSPSVSLGVVRNCIYKINFLLAIFLGCLEDVTQCLEMWSKTLFCVFDVITGT